MFIKPHIYLFLFLAYQCANPKIINPSSKIGFDINALDEEGLAGKPGSKVAVDFEFCIPAETHFLNEVLKIDASLQIQKKAKGRISCSKAEWLCLGNTHQEHSRRKIQLLAELSFVKRIERTYFE